jgi:hypothetical protein
VGPYDRAVYRKEDGKGNWLEVACIVDDMVIADYGGVLIVKFAGWLEEHWGSGRKLVGNVVGKPIKYQPLTVCLGRSVDIDTKSGIVIVSGPQYIDDMYKRYMDPQAEELVRAHKADVPCEEGIMKLSTISERQSAEAASLTRSLVQSLAYAANKFKPEILFHVGRLQRFADKPCNEAYRLALQVLKYCYKDKQFGCAWSRSNVEDSSLEVTESNDELCISARRRRRRTSSSPRPRCATPPTRAPACQCARPGSRRCERPQGRSRRTPRPPLQAATARAQRASSGGSLAQARPRRAQSRRRGSRQQAAETGTRHSCRPPQC